MSEEKNLKTALLLGASGLVGGELLALLAKSYAKVIVVNRTKFKVELTPNCTELVLNNFDQLESLNLKEKVDHIYCCLGTTIKKAGSKEAFRKVDYSYALSTALLGKRYGATSMAIISSKGANKKSPFFYLRVKGQIEEKLMHEGFQSLLIFQPTLLIGERKEKRPGEEIGARLFKLLKPLMFGSLKKQLPVTAFQVASCMLEEMKKEESGIYIIDAERIREEQKSAS